MVSDDPRIFTPEIEQQELVDDVIRGYLNTDGSPRGQPPPASVGGGGGFALAMVLMPFIAVLLAALSWIGAFAGAAPRMRSVLTGALPGGWVAVGRDGAGAPLAVGVTLGVVALVVLAGLILARHSLVRVWVGASGFLAFLVWLAVFAISALMVLVLILIPGLVLVGTSIATGADLGSTPLPDGATVRNWPLVLTAGAAAWFALGATRRTARKRSARRAALHRQVPGRGADAPGTWHD